MQMSKTVKNEDSESSLDIKPSEQGEVQQEIQQEVRQEVQVYTPREDNMENDKLQIFRFKGSDFAVWKMQDEAVLSMKDY